MLFCRGERQTTLDTRTESYLLAGSLPPTDSRLPPMEELIPLVYGELRAIAHRQLLGERRNLTLQTTALVHEAYFRLAGDRRITEKGRAYFFAAASRAMRQILIQAARRRGTRKRGGGEIPAQTDEEAPGDRAIGEDDFACELLDLDRALEVLEARNPRYVRVVECRFFGGMNVEETAIALGVSPRTVKADWALARSWLRRALVEERAS